MNEDWADTFNNIVERLRDINLAEIDFDDPPPELYEGIEELIPYDEDEDDFMEEDEDPMYILETFERL